MAKKLGIRIIYGCGKVSLIKYTSRKKAERQYKLACVNDAKLWNGTEYTSDYKVERVCV